MGSIPLIIDHNVMLQLWLDPLFWECVVGFEDYREMAEVEAVFAMADSSSLSIKRSTLYNHMLQDLKNWAETESDQLKQFTDFVHKKRKYRPESILVIVNGHLVVLSNGVEQ